LVSIIILGGVTVAAAVASVKFRPARIAKLLSAVVGEPLATIFAKHTYVYHNTPQNTTAFLHFGYCKMRPFVVQSAQKDNRAMENSKEYIKQHEDEIKTLLGKLTDETLFCLGIVGGREAIAQYDAESLLYSIDKTRRHIKMVDPDSYGAPVSIVDDGEYKIVNFVSKTSRVMEKERALQSVYQSPTLLHALQSMSLNRVGKIKSLKPLNAEYAYRHDFQI
jgi:hypothetical protein